MVYLVVPRINKTKEDLFAWVQIRKKKLSMRMLVCKHKCIFDFVMNAACSEDKYKVHSTKHKAQSTKYKV